MTTADTASTPASSPTPQDGFRQVSEESRELRELRRKNREPEQRNIAGGNKFHRAGVRPATPLICEFIDQHREECGVVPICRALVVHGVNRPAHLPGAPLAGPSKRALWDTTVTEILAGYYGPDADGKRPPESLYGSLKMWAHLQRQGIAVARRTVERIVHRAQPSATRLAGLDRGRLAGT